MMNEVPGHQRMIPFVPGMKEKVGSGVHPKDKSAGKQQKDCGFVILPGLEPPGIPVTGQTHGKGKNASYPVVQKISRLLLVHVLDETVSCGKVRPGRKSSAGFFILTSKISNHRICLYGSAAFLVF
jgi:hypothetical protein